MNALDVRVQMRCQTTNESTDVKKVTAIALCTGYELKQRTHSTTREGTFDRRTVRRCECVCACTSGTDASKIRSDERLLRTEKSYAKLIFRAPK